MGNLSAFMRKEFKKNTLVEIEGFERFVDDKGKPVPFKVKRLGFDEINRIRDFYSTERVAYDKKTRRPIVVDGVVAKEVKYDNDKANANVFVEALAYPNLKDKELMEFYECDEYIQMPKKVFTPVEYNELMRRIWIVLGLIKPDEYDEDAKNEYEDDEQEDSDVADIKNA